MLVCSERMFLFQRFKLSCVSCLVLAWTDLVNLCENNDARKGRLLLLLKHQSSWMMVSAGGGEELADQPVIGVSDPCMDPQEKKRSCLFKNQ